ncbi:hypothetical protein I2483_13255 [Sporosarcina sp. E16_3]|uniref:hypothetical protein n=1 Tax=Sporosarcina sp. E16_3 TaxID=2789293 RepID=UPI001A936E81|nr:hypothetical protein [Sporosarcina sp. E16_3]MBO0602629.1 hypothetical protein [Sporosarcina sp. E16_3]
MNFKSIDIQVVDDSGAIVVQNGILVESDQFCAIYDIDEGHFKFVCTTSFELNIMLATQDLRMKDPEEEERLCSECGITMQEGFYFESDGTQYCSEECLTKVITWDEYLAIHDDGNGGAYWTEWYDV